MGSDIGAQDIMYEMGKTIRSLRYMISCEEYDEDYTGLPCAKDAPDPPDELSHRCLMCQLWVKQNEIDRLTRENHELRQAAR